MDSLLLSDAGPLFSFAAGGLLDVLLNFELIITDVVKMETIDRGSLPDPSYESKQLATFYESYADSIRIEPTQLGHLVGIPGAHAGELSVQSMVIDLVGRSPGTKPALLFEDRWFIKNRASFHPSCTLISTLAFLLYLERDGLIPSAMQAEAKIRLRRPHFLAERWVFRGGNMP
ncbi:hypothetical protein [Janthinobacterium sp. HH01]|uniref:hypothetical protein n=1 Tax=Janthinobacterium sp. HH01 TaxID=1198452 RepID=UPI001268D288|nr:hypothetical protein [Janthinobacterium sp. HH01]